MTLTRKFSKLMIPGIISAGLLITGCSSDNADSEKEKTDTSDVNYSEAIDYTITGIEPGAGISVATEKALEEYDSLKGWEVQLASTAAMLVELDQAIEKEEPIIVTGWNPHWMFSKHPEMKYLEDPKGIYGGEETISTLVTPDLKDSKPNAYKVLDQFEWDIEDMEDIMYEAAENDTDIEDVAKQWVADNEDKTAMWIEGIDDANGESVELVSTPWDSEIASSSVLKEVMESVGFDVKVTPVDVAIVFESLANGDADATIAAWLPYTHEQFYEKHEDNFEDLGPNLHGAIIGLVVPEYMDIDSIEDLEAK